MSSAPSRGTTKVTGDRELYDRYMPLVRRIVKQASDGNYSFMSIILGIIAATLGAIEALANVGGPHPWWSLGVFAVCLWVIHGIWVLGKPENV